MSKLHTVYTRVWVEKFWTIFAKYYFNSTYTHVVAGEIRELTSLRKTGNKNQEIREHICEKSENYILKVIKHRFGFLPGYTPNVWKGKNANFSLIFSLKYYHQFSTNFNCTGWCLAFTYWKDLVLLLNFRFNYQFFRYFVFFINSVFSQLQQLNSFRLHTLWFTRIGFFSSHILLWIFDSVISLTWQNPIFYSHISLSLSIRVFHTSANSRFYPLSSKLLCFITI